MPDKWLPPRRAPTCTPRRFAAARYAWPMATSGRAAEWLCSCITNKGHCHFLYKDLAPFVQPAVKFTFSQDGSPRNKSNERAGVPRNLAPNMRWDIWHKISSTRFHHRPRRRVRNKHSFYANLRPATLQQELLSRPRFGALEAHQSKSPPLRRRAFFALTGIASRPEAKEPLKIWLPKWVELYPRCIMCYVYSSLLLSRWLFLICLYILCLNMGGTIWRKTSSAGFRHRPCRHHQVVCKLYNIKP